MNVQIVCTYQAFYFKLVGTAEHAGRKTQPDEIELAGDKAAVCVLRMRNALGYLLGVVFMSKTWLS